MILRVDGDQLIVANIGRTNDEDSFIALNPGFIKVDTLPYSVSCRYKYDIDGTTIIVDEAAELDALKASKMEEIDDKFDELMFHGEFVSSLGFRTDNRRGNGKDDKDNVSSLIDLGMEPIYFKDKDDQYHVLTNADLVVLKQEMIQDGLGKYQWKWNKQGEVMAATTIEELEAVII